jgi:transcription elongation factor Elf1
MKAKDYVRDYGYKWGVPSSEAATLDRQVCSESKCEECGHEGLSYQPIHKEGSYIAFAVCPQCGAAHEF